MLLNEPVCSNIYTVNLFLVPWYVTLRHRVFFLHVFWECPVVMDLWTHVDLVLSSSLNAKEKAVCWFCGCEEDDDVELVWAARVWRGILDCILLLLYFYFFLFFFFLTYCMWLYKGRTCFVVTFSLPLSLSPLIGPLKHGVCVCCFVLFVLSGCYVVMFCVKKENKKCW